MKKVLSIIAAAALLAACGSKEETTTVSGKIIGYNGEYTEFFIQNGDTFDEYHVEVAEDGTFTTTLKMKEDWWDAPFFVDKFMFRTCIQKGKNYTAEFDITIPEVEDRFRFIGEGEKENEFCRVFFNQFYFAWLFLDTIGDPASFQEYSQKVSAKAEECRALLEAAGNPGLSAYYAPMIDNQEKQLSFYYPYMALARDGKYVPEDSYKAFLADSRLEQLPGEDVQLIFNGVAAYASGLKGLNILEAVKLAKDTFTKKEYSDFAMTTLLKGYMQMGNTEGVREAYDWYIAQNPAQEYIDQVKDLKEATLALVPGSEAPEIELMDTEGNTLNLSSLFGKVLYIDFWATWCGPCRAEIPYMEKVAASYAGSSKVSCISISIDEDIDAWKADVAEAKPAWPQYVVTAKGQQQVAGDYKINAIPRFVIIDALGKLVEVNAERPSSATVKEQIDAAIR